MWHRSPDTAILKTIKLFNLAGVKGHKVQKAHVQYEENPRYAPETRIEGGKNILKKKYTLDLFVEKLIRATKKN